MATDTRTKTRDELLDEALDGLEAVLLDRAKFDSGYDALLRRAMMRTPWVPASPRLPVVVEVGHPTTFGLLFRTRATFLSFEVRRSKGGRVTADLRTLAIRDCGPMARKQTLMVEEVFRTVSQSLTMETPGQVERPIRCTDPAVVENFTANLSASPNREALDPEAMDVLRYRRIVRRMLRAIPVERRALIEEMMRPWRPSMSPTQFLAVADCLRVPGPEWQVQAVRTVPALKGLYDGIFPGAVRHAYLERIASGAPALNVAIDAIGKVTDQGRRLAGVGKTCARSLGNMDLERLASNPEPFMTAITAFHAAQPAHPCLTPAQVGQVFKAIDSIPHAWMAIQDGGIAERVVPALLDRSGEAGDIDWDMDDAVKAAKASIEAMFRTSGIEPDPDNVPMTLGQIVFPEGRRFETLWRLETEWHDHVAHDVAASLSNLEDEVRNRLDASEPLPAFANPLSAPLFADGVTITPLTDRKAFNIEGETMRHCIATYADDARTARIVAFSLSGPDGARSSASCDVGPDGGLTLDQVRGVGNAKADPRHVDAMRLLVDRCNADEGIKRTLEAAVMAHVAADIRRRRDDRLGTAVPTPTVELMNDEERERWLDLHWRNVAAFLGKGERNRGRSAWIADVKARLASQGLHDTSASQDGTAPSPGP